LLTNSGPDVERNMGRLLASIYHEVIGLVIESNRSTMTVLPASTMTQALSFLLHRYHTQMRVMCACYAATSPEDSGSLCKKQRVCGELGQYTEARSKGLQIEQNTRRTEETEAFISSAV
jgi:hypothetical protein